MISSNQHISEDLMYFGEDPETRGAIIRTIIRLPEDIASFVLERCSFVSVGRAAMGIVLPGRIGVDSLTKQSENVWIIVLDERVPPEETEANIAHEIAHAWRGDDRLGFMSDDCEIETANLVKRWGFTGLGANPDHCNRPYAM